MAVFLGAGATVAQGQQFWRTDGTAGTWTAANWGASAGGPFTTSYTSNSNVQFTADSTVTFASASVGNVTVADNKAVTVTSAGTMSTNGAVRTFDIGAGATLNWAGQSWSTVAGVGFIKNGAGTWNIGAQGNALNATNGGFTLNAGTVIVSGNNSFGGSASILTINGGNIQSSGTRGYANNLTIGGNFTNSGTGNATFSGTVALGAATRTITNTTTSGSRIYSGVISGASGSGLTFDGTGAGQTYIGNAANTFTGTITISGSEVGFASNGAVGNAANTIVIDGGRFSAASTAGGSVTYTLASTHGIQVGSSAGTSISVVSGGSLSYDGVISDKSGATGAWAKQGSGTLVLGGVSTYSGDTAINNGTLQLTTGNDRLPTGTSVALGQAASTNLGTLDLNGRSQQIAGLNSTVGTNATVSKNTVTSTAAATLTIGGSGSYSFSAGTTANSGLITGAITLIKSGNGTQFFGESNSYTGKTTINGGYIAGSGESIFGAAPGSFTADQITMNGGGIQASGGDMAFSSTRGITLGSSGGTFDTNSNNITVSSTNIIAGFGALSKVGAGALTVQGSNTYTGGTTLSGGTAVAANNGAFGSTAAQTVTFNGGKLASDNDSRSLSNNLTVNNVAGNQITGASVTLTGNASGAGTLDVALDSAKSVTVNPGTTNGFAMDTISLTSGTLLLGASNSVGNATNVKLNGGTLDLNNFSEGSPGTVGLGSLILSGTSILDYGTLGGGANLIEFTGIGSHTSATALQITDFDIGSDHLYFAGSAGTFNAAFSQSEVSFNGLSGYSTLSFGGYYEIVAVPEPATIFGALGLLGLIGYRERRFLRFPQKRKARNSERRS